MISDVYIGYLFVRTIATRPIHLTLVDIYQIYQI